MIDHKLLIPPPLWKRMEEFSGDRKTGQAVLHFKDGQILAWALTETGRVVDRPCDSVVDLP